MSQNTPPGLMSDKGFPGMKYDIRPDTVGSYAAEREIQPGIAVTYGTDKDNQCDFVDNAADKFLGVALHQHTLINSDANGLASYRPKQTVSVLRKGAVLVEATTTIAAGDPAYVVVGAGADQGKFTNVANANLAVPDGKFLSSGVDGDTVVLEIL